MSKLKHLLATLLFVDKPEDSINFEDIAPDYVG